MFQLNLPHTHTTAHRSQRRLKTKIFGNKQSIPCVFCSTLLSFNDATIEHVIPLSKGGTHNHENLTISCFDCNNERGTVPFEEWKHIVKFNKLVLQLIKLDKIVGRCVV